MIILMVIVMMIVIMIVMMMMIVLMIYVSNKQLCKQRGVGRNQLRQWNCLRNHTYERSENRTSIKTYLQELCCLNVRSEKNFGVSNCLQT